MKTVDGINRRIASARDFWKQKDVATAARNSGTKLHKDIEPVVNTTPEATITKKDKFAVVRRKPEPTLTEEQRTAGKKATSEPKAFKITEISIPAYRGDAPSVNGLDTTDKGDVGTIYPSHSNISVFLKRDIGNYRQKIGYDYDLLTSTNVESTISGKTKLLEEQINTLEELNAHDDLKSKKYDDLKSKNSEEIKSLKELNEKLLPKTQVDTSESEPAITGVELPYASGLTFLEEYYVTPGAAKPSLGASPMEVADSRFNVSIPVTVGDSSMSPRDAAENLKGYITTLNDCGLLADGLLEKTTKQIDKGVAKIETALAKNAAELHKDIEEKAHVYPKINSTKESTEKATAKENASSRFSSAKNFWQSKVGADNAVPAPNKSSGKFSVGKVETAVVQSTNLKAREIKSPSLKALIVNLDKNTSPTR